MLGISHSPRPRGSPQIAAPLATCCPQDPLFLVPAFPKRHNESCSGASVFPCRFHYTPLDLVPPLRAEDKGSSTHAVRRFQALLLGHDHNGTLKCCFSPPQTNVTAFSVFFSCCESFRYFSALFIHFFCPRVSGFVGVSSLFRRLLRQSPVPECVAGNFFLLLASGLPLCLLLGQAFFFPSLPTASPR